ncbi:GntR family transcriptional regulator [Secundilactobacillus hailunensis]|uniref:GntR family transcriptional regulator n=2 Tax=Secundilactobacillus hailunensis TaxID=2559923 RepID=A0ABW1T6S9_9LACO
MPTNIRVASIMRKAILSGEYSGGEELSLTQIATELGVSRTPVREAFQKLGSEGLIVLRMNKGAIVSKIDKKFITDHFEVRIILESAAVKRATENQMDVQGLIDRERALIDSPAATVEDFASLNQTIHTAIWKAADNNKLYKILEELWNGASTNTIHPALEHHLKSAHEHIELLTEIKKGHAEVAENIMKKHLLRSMNNILDNFNFTQNI